MTVIVFARTCDVGFGNNLDLEQFRMALIGKPKRESSLWFLLGLK